MDDALLSNMRERVELCRRLADATHDPRVSESLRRMAEDIERDLNRLEEGELRSPS